MQQNSGQIRVQTVSGGVNVILLNIDLHFKAPRDGTVYLVAKANDAAIPTKNKWKIYHFWSAQEIKEQFGIDRGDLPRSSRTDLVKELEVQPVGLKKERVNQLVNDTHFASERVKKKSSKRWRCRMLNCKCGEFLAESSFEPKCETWSGGKRGDAEAGRRGIGAEAGSD
jgi:hypothetical protein